MLAVYSLRQQIGIIVVTVAALLVVWGGRAAAQEPEPACPDAVETWPLTAALLVPPENDGLRRLICTYDTPGGYDDPDYGNSLAVGAHWWPEGTQVPSWLCPIDLNYARQLPSSVAAAEVGWNWTFESAFSDVDLEDAAQGLLRQIEPLAQRCPQDTDDSTVAVVISSAPTTVDESTVTAIVSPDVTTANDAQAPPTPPATSDDSGGLGALAIPAAIAAGAGIVAWQIQTRRRARHTPTLGDRLAADALREAIETANAPSLGDQLAAEQIRQGLALGHLYPFDGILETPPE